MNSIFCKFFPGKITLYSVILITFLGVSQGLAHEVEKYSDIQFAQIEGVDPNLLSLDIFKEKDRSKLPIMIYIHGGCFTSGDKILFGDNKVDGLLKRGFMLISANYRLAPEYEYPAHIKDLASTISWTYKNIENYGGDPDRIFLMGHSSGAHNVAHVATDPRYLREQGLTLNVIKGVIPNDVDTYDLPMTAVLFGGWQWGCYLTAFTNEPVFWDFASPITYIRPDINIPPMVLLYSNVELRPIMDDLFVYLLNYNGTMSMVIAAIDKDHGSIDFDFGREDDYVTQKTMAFIETLTPFSRLSFKSNLNLASKQINQYSLKNSEIIYLESHKNILFAGLSYDRDSEELTDSDMILIKDSKTDSWKIDFQTENITPFKLTSLASVQFTTDKDGIPLNPPISILFSSFKDNDTDVNLYARDDQEGKWIKTVLERDSLNSELSFVSHIIDHIDKLTGIHHIFAITGSSKIFKGAFDPSKPGKVFWEPDAEVTFSNQIASVSRANESLYIFNKNDELQSSASSELLKRNDGLQPSWESIHTFNNSSSYRFLSTVEDPVNNENEILIVTDDNSGILYKIELEDEFKMTEEFDYKNYFIKIWGRLGYATKFIESRDVPELKYRIDNDNLNIIGLSITHPEHDQPAYSGSYYLVRHQEAGSYEWGVICDPEKANEGLSLSACNAIAVSPFEEDRGKVLYFAGKAKNNKTDFDTAWIYRGEYPENECQRSPFAEVCISSKILKFVNQDILEVKTKVENFSSELIDLYSAISLNGELYWFPDWNSTPTPIAIQDSEIWRKILLETPLTPELKKTDKRIIFYSALTKHRTFDLIDIDQKLIEFE